MVEIVFYLLGKFIQTSSQDIGNDDSEIAFGNDTIGFTITEDVLNAVRLLFVY